MAKKQSATGAEVREFLTSQGITVGSRGRFSVSQVEAFEKATGKRYVVGHVVPVKLTGKVVSASGRTVPRTVKATLPQVRAWAQSPEGVKVLGDDLAVGARGRIAAPVKAAFAAHAPKA
jgi:hypothetical protein